MKCFTSICMLLVACLLVITTGGCSWTSTSNTTVSTGEGSEETVTTETTTETTTEAIISDEDLSAASTVISLASTAWDLVSSILSDLEDTDKGMAISKATVTSTAATSATISTGVTITQDEGIAKAKAIIAVCYKKSGGKYPNAADVAVYIAKGTMPSEAAYETFVDTGYLCESE